MACSTTCVCPCKRRPLWAQTVTDVFVYELLMRLLHIGNFCFWVPFLKQLLLRNCTVDFVEICNVYVGKMIIKAAKRILNSEKICRRYSDLNFGVTFLGTQCIYGECAHEQHVRRTLTLTNHTITAYSVSGNVVHVCILICAARQKPCRKRKKKKKTYPVSL